MTTNRKALDTRSAADYLHIAKTQSTEYAIMAINNNICNTLNEIGIEPATDSLMESICANIEKLEQANDNREVDCITLGDAVMDVFYGAFTDYVGLRPDYVCDVDKDWMDPTREGNECFVDSSDWEWCFDVRRDGDIYYMAADGSITTYWQDSLPWCRDGFYICDQQVDSFGNIVLIIAMCH